MRGEEKDIGLDAISPLAPSSSREEFLEINKDGRIIQRYILHPKKDNESLEETDRSSPCQKQRSTARPANEATGACLRFF